MYVCIYILYIYMTETRKKNWVGCDIGLECSLFAYHLVHTVMFY